MGREVRPWGAETRESGDLRTAGFPGEMVLCDECDETYGAPGMGLAIVEAEAEGWDCDDGERCPECARKVRA